MGFRVWRLGFGDLGLRVFGFRASASGFGVLGFYSFGLQGLEFLRFRVLGLTHYAGPFVPG